MIRLISLILFALLALATSSCVATLGDLHEQAAQMEKLATNLDTVKAKADAALKAANEVPGIGTNGGIAGTITLAALLALNAYRNKTRASELAALSPQTPGGGT